MPTRFPTVLLFLATSSACAGTGLARFQKSLPSFEDAKGNPADQRAALFACRGHLGEWVTVWPGADVLCARTEAFAAAWRFPAPTEDDRKRALATEEYRAGGAEKLQWRVVGCHPKLGVVVSPIPSGAAYLFAVPFEGNEPAAIVFIDSRSTFDHQAGGLESCELPDGDESRLAASVGRGPVAVASKFRAVRARAEAIAAQPPPDTLGGRMRRHADHLEVLSRHCPTLGNVKSRTAKDEAVLQMRAALPESYTTWTCAPSREAPAGSTGCSYRSGYCTDDGFARMAGLMRAEAAKEWVTRFDGGDFGSRIDALVYYDANPPDALLRPSIDRMALPVVKEGAVREWKAAPSGSTRRIALALAIQGLTARNEPRTETFLTRDELVRLEGWFPVFRSETQLPSSAEFLALGPAGLLRAASLDRLGGPEVRVIVHPVQREQRSHEVVEWVEIPGEQAPVERPRVPSEAELQLRAEIEEKRNALAFERARLGFKENAEQGVRSGYTLDGRLGFEKIGGGPSAASTWVRLDAEFKILGHESDLATLERRLQALVPPEVPKPARPLRGATWEKRIRSEPHVDLRRLIEVRLPGGDVMKQEFFAPRGAPYMMELGVAGGIDPLPLLRRAYRQALAMSYKSVVEKRLAEDAGDAAWLAPIFGFGPAPGSDAAGRFVELVSQRGGQL